MLAPVFLLSICSFPKCGNGSTHNCRKKPSPLSDRTVIGDGVLRPKTASCRETGNSQHAMTTGVAGSVHCIIIYTAYIYICTTRAVKSCQKTHLGNRSRQHRLTVYTQAYSHVDQGRSCHLCQTQFKCPGHYLCE